MLKIGESSSNRDAMRVSLTINPKSDRDVSRVRSEAVMAVVV